MAMRLIHILLSVLLCLIEGHKDPYRVLGVTPNAPQAEIKRSYRKLCLKYHPDKNRSNPKRKEFESLFKEVQQAYDHIGTAKARRQYDATHPFSRRAQGSWSSSKRGSGRRSRNNNHGRPKSHDYDSDWNTHYFPQWSSGKQQGKTPTTFEDMMREYQKAYQKMFDDEWNFGFPDEPSFQDFRKSFETKDSPWNGGKQSIFRHTVEVPLEELYRGKDHFEFHFVNRRPWASLVAAFRGGIGPICLYRSLIYAAPLYKVSKLLSAAVAVYFFHRYLPKPNIQRFSKPIPRGCRSGNMFVFQDKADSNVQYHFEVVPIRHKRFRLEGGTLWTTFTISPEKARRGCVVQLKGLSGNPISAKFPANLKDGHVLTVPNEGWPLKSSSSDQTLGDLMIKVRVSSKQHGQSR